MGTVKLEAEASGGEPASPLVTFVDSTTSRQMEEPSLPRKLLLLQPKMHSREFDCLYRFRLRS